MDVTHHQSLGTSLDTGGPWIENTGASFVSDGWGKAYHAIKAMKSAMLVMGMV